MGSADYRASDPPDDTRARTLSCSYTRARHVGKPEKGGACVWCGGGVGVVRPGPRYASRGSWRRNGGGERAPSWPGEGQQRKRWRQGACVRRPHLGTTTMRRGANETFGSVACCPSSLTSRILRAAFTCLDLTSSPNTVEDFFSLVHN